MNPADATPPSAALPRSARRLAWALIGMAVLTAALGVMAISALSAARAYVGAEGQWSRAQKTAVHALLRYLAEGDDAQWRLWQAEIAVPLGARRSREAMDAGQADTDTMAEGLVAARNHPDDARAMVRLYRCCGALPFMAEPISIWREADGLVAQLLALATEGRRLREAGDATAAAALTAPVLALDARLTPLEARFSARLGEASRLVGAGLQGTLAATALLVGLGGSLMVRRRARREQASAQALLRSETLFRSLWETTDDGVLLIGLDHHIRFANPALHTLLGHAPGALVGQPLACIQPERLRSAHRAGMDRHLATGERRLDWRSTEALALRADGQELPVELRFSRFELGSESLFVSFMRDITERKRARERLEQRVAERTEALTQANQRLTELDRLKSEFLATMSHELRTPLNAILGFTELLRQGVPGAVNTEQVRQLEHVKGAGQHLLALINDLLDLSQIESGRMSVACEPLDFTEVATEVAERLRPLAERKGLALRLDLPATLPWMGDRRKLAQVLFNLLGNAIKFTPEGRVGLRAWLDDEGLGFEVSDSGIGIPPEQHALLFQAFRQLDAGTRRSHEGTGLGLFLCAQLLGLMGGRIAHTPVAGGGACFQVRVAVAEGG